MLVAFMTVQDFGYPQETSMDSLKGFITNIPTVEKKIMVPLVEEKKNVFAEFFKFGSSKEKESDVSTLHKEELYVDIIEKMTLVLDSKVVLGINKLTR